jgi:hypothetical protein
MKKKDIDNKTVRKNLRLSKIRRRPQEAKMTRYKDIMVAGVLTQFGSRFYFYDDDTYWEEILNEYQQNTSDSNRDSDTDMVTSS